MILEVQGHMCAALEIVQLLQVILEVYMTPGLQTNWILLADWLFYMK